MDKKEVKFHCGPQVLPMFIRKWLSSKFNNVCKLHDEAYTKNVNNRFTNDRVFLIRMVNLSKKDSDVILGIIYYINVRIFGRFFKKEK